MRRFFLLSLMVLAACASPKKTTGIVAAQCGPTPIMVKDLESFGFNVAKNKVAVMRIFASWCPYCKEDLTEIGKRFQKGDYTAESTQVLLLSYKNRRENISTYTAFVRDTFPKFGIPSNAAQIIYVDKEYADLFKSKGAAGEALFTGWQGVPFGLVFAKDGRLAFRGHFTNSPTIQDRHYDFIQDLTKESCPP